MKNIQKTNKLFYCLGGGGGGGGGIFWIALIRPAKIIVS